MTPSILGWIVLTRELSDYERWDEEEIEKRGRQLATEAVRIWIGPKDPIVPVVAQDHEDSVGRRELRQQFWSGLSDYLAAEHPEIPQFEARPSWTLRLPSGIRHVGFDLRLGLRQKTVGIDLWFWRAASRPVWDRIRTAPESYDKLIGTGWNFEPVEGRDRARMFVDRPANDLRSDSTWPELYKWFGENLSLLYEKIAPKLREEFERADAPSIAG